MNEPKTFEEALDIVLSRMRETMIKKNRDYGPNNIAKFGEYGVLIRSNDKLERLINLYNTGRQPENESIDDTWLDLANYGLIAQMLRLGLWGLPYGNDDD